MSRLSKSGEFFQTGTPTNMSLLLRRRLKIHYFSRAEDSDKVNMNQISILKMIDCKMGSQTYLSNLQFFYVVVRT